MTMQWILERNNDTKIVQSDPHFKSQKDFHFFIEEVDLTAPQLIASLADTLLTPDQDLEVEFPKDFTLDKDRVLTVACAYALGKAPQLATWKKVRKIMRNSWQVENWLSESMVAYAHKHPAIKEPYTKLARLLFEKLDNGSLHSESERKNEQRKSALIYWQDLDYPLEELWWGLRVSDFMNYEEEMPVVRLLSEIAPEVLHQLLKGANNPFLLDTALLNIGAGGFSPCFAKWETCIKSAPPSFEDSGFWKGSAMLPLLLMHARNQLIEPGIRTPRYSAEATEIVELTAQVTELVQAVVDVLASRDDAAGTIARWSTWLMQQVLRNGRQEYNDIRSPSFVDNLLIEKMSKAVQVKPIIQNISQDAAPWEDWCYYCVQTSAAYDGSCEMPSFTQFSEEWDLTPEDWRGQKGRDLLQRAEHHLVGDDVPGLSANLLVLPVASKTGFLNAWQQLWHKASQLREILEFGSFDAGKQTYSDRVDASRLLLLLGRMGLACFDQTSSRLNKSSPKKCVQEIGNLHSALSNAIMEILHLDDTINRDKWQNLLLHIAVRRVCWDNRSSTQERIAVFVEQDEPNISNYLTYFTTDPAEMVTFLHTCILNGADVTTLREELKSASIDPGSCVETLKQLHDLKEARYPLNKHAIKAIKQLMN